MDEGSTDKIFDEHRVSCRLVETSSVASKTDWAGNCRSSSEIQLTEPAEKASINSR